MLEGMTFWIAAMCSRLRKNAHGKKKKSDNNVWATSATERQRPHENSKRKKRKKYRCLWIKVPYPVPEDCVCACSWTQPWRFYISWSPIAVMCRCKQLKLYCMRLFAHTPEQLWLTLDQLIYPLLWCILVNTHRRIYVLTHCDANIFGNSCCDWLVQPRP